MPIKPTIASYSLQGIKELYANLEDVVTRRVVDGLIRRYSDIKDMTDLPSIKQDFHEILRLTFQGSRSAEFIEAEYEWAIDETRRWNGRGCHRVKVTFRMAINIMRACRDLGLWTGEQTSARVHLLKLVARVDTWQELDAMSEVLLNPQAPCTCYDVWGPPDPPAVHHQSQKRGRQSLSPALSSTAANTSDDDGSLAVSNSDTSFVGNKFDDTDNEEELEEGEIRVKHRRRLFRDSESS